MKFRTYFLLLFFLASFLGCSAENGASQQQAPKKDNLIQDPYSWDFGRVKEGRVLRHVFLLKNDSKKRLKIRAINTSCGCTASQVKKKNLLPGESTVIKVSFNTKGYSGLTEQFVYVNTDSQENPITRFVIKADITK